MNLMGKTGTIELCTREAFKLCIPHDFELYLYQRLLKPVLHMRLAVIYLKPKPDFIRKHSNISNLWIKF